MIGTFIRLGGLRGLAIAAVVVAGLPAARAQTQQQIDICVNHDNRSQPDERITTCTMVIKSGRWSGKNLAWAFTARGNANRQKGNYDDAIADHTQAIKLDPSDPDRYYNRGIVYSDKKAPDRAIADYGKAISLASNASKAWAKGEQIGHDRIVADYYEGRANLYYRKADYVHAIADYSEAFRLNPARARTLYWRGKSKQQIGDTNGASADIAAAKAKDPSLGN